MKYLNNKILESIQRGINLAIDDIEDASIEYQKKSKIENNIHTKDLLQWIDLGLPSGTLWAKYNVGVDPHKLNNVSDWYGGYYAWGEIEEKQVYYWKTYKHANGDFNKLTKYCNDVGYCDDACKPDNLTTLQDEDNVVFQTNKLPLNVKMPTKEQFEELLEYTTNEWVENYHGITGLNGRIFTSKTNGNQLFIPAAGCRVNSSVYDVDLDCNLWSCSLDQNMSGGAHILYFYSAECYLSANYRCLGLSVRSVLIK